MGPRDGAQSSAEPCRLQEWERRHNEMAEQLGGAVRDLERERGGWDITEVPGSPEQRLLSSSLLRSTGKGALASPGGSLSANGWRAQDEQMSKVPPRPAPPARSRPASRVAAR